jgi:hypothetical protein
VFGWPISAQLDPPHVASTLLVGCEAIAPVLGHAKRALDAHSVDTKIFLVSVGSGCHGVAYLRVRCQMREYYCTSAG